MNNTNKNRRPLLILLAAFILPVAAAKLILTMDWYQGAATNTGELIQPGVDYKNFTMENPSPKRWQMVYLLPTQCEQACQDRLYVLHQSKIALGKDQHRITPLIFVTPTSDIAAIKDYEYSTYNASESLSRFLTQQQLVIVDPLGQWVMQYQLTQGKQTQILQGKAMVKDVRKMLKLSRVG